MPFISVSCLISLPWTSSTMLNSSGKSGHSCLIPDLWGKAFDLLLFIVLRTFYYFKKNFFFLFVVCWVFLSWKGVEFLWSAFIVSLEMILWFLSFFFFLLRIFICWTILTIPGTHSVWSWCIILLMCCWIWFVSVEYFCINIH